jgi:peptide chain release factor 1
LFEIRQGVGGEEAALWVRQLARMFTRYADRRHWACKVLSTSEAKAGGLKECILAISGAGASVLLDETGTHRIQRVSPTDSRGRVHTSAATVAVLAEPKKEDFVLDLNEVEIQTFHASGHGGQNINKLETAVRVRHRPSGLVVSMQDERYQARNRSKALRILAARLAARARLAAQTEERDLRRAQLGSGDRSVKMRTYDFPEGMVVDHRRGVRSNRLTDILDGDLDLLRPQGWKSLAPPPDVDCLPI